MPFAHEPVKDTTRRSRGSGEPLSLTGSPLRAFAWHGGLKYSAVDSGNHNHVVSGGSIIYTKFPRCDVAQYDRGDYVKVEFPADTPGLPGEWMWVRVHHCDDESQLLFGTLDNEPVVNPEDLELAQELAISYSQIREHRKPSEFRKN
jgi:hypothetical protein